jgi:GNAT superfamily N-acetyltransferase
MINIQYRPMKAGEEQAASELVVRLFKDVLTMQQTEQGRETFIEKASPEGFAHRQQHDHFILVAVEGKKVIGLIEVRHGYQISLLFVDPLYQQLGISKVMFHHVIDYCLTRNPLLASLEAFASPGATGIYEHLGFEVVGDEFERDDIRYVPMSLELGD